MKQQFDLSLWLKDKSRKIVTRNNIEVEIIHDSFPLVAIINGVAYNFDNNGKFQSNKTNHKYDLFFADEEEELTEFEKELINAFNDAQLHTASDGEVFAKKYKEKLLDLARKELEANYYTKVIDDRMVFKSELHEQSLQTAYDMGKQDALKDLPKWKKITEEEQNYLAYGYLSNYGYYLSIQELKDKLPKEE